MAGQTGAQATFYDVPQGPALEAVLGAAVGAAEGPRCLRAFWWSRVRRSWAAGSWPPLVALDREPLAGLCLPCQESKTHAGDSPGGGTLGTGPGPAGHTHLSCVCGWHRKRGLRESRGESVSHGVLRCQGHSGLWKVTLPASAAHHSSPASRPERIPGVAVPRRGSPKHPGSSGRSLSTSSPASCTPRSG